MCIVTLWYMLLLVCARTATLIYNQDGFGFSGTIQANPIVCEIAMTAYNSWPAEVYSTTKNTFAGGVFDGQSVWLVPQSADAMVRLRAYWR